MNENGFKFSRNSEIKVTMKLECFDIDIIGTLKLIANQLPKLEFDSLSGRGYGSIILSEQEKICLDCRSEKYTYKLYENESEGDDVWPKYITQRQSFDSIHGIEVLLSGVSEWIDQETYFDITKTEIKKNHPEEVFDEYINYGGDEYRIKSNYNCSIKKVVDRDFTVSETTTISLLNTDTNISFKKTESLSHKLNTLFSLLLASPLSIEAVWVLDKEGKKKAPFYFSTIGRTEPPFKYTRECLIHPSRISNNVGWRTIFNNYFSDENIDSFNDIWARIPVLLSYKGSWDFEILGYVSILDSYCSKYVDKKGKKLNKSDYQLLKRELTLVVEEYSENLDDSYEEVLASFKEGIKGIRNTNLPTFKEKYDFMLDNIDQGIRNIVNLRPTEFIQIKKIRDSAAHGLTIKTQKKGDISYEFSLKDRLLVLLIYFVYKELGISQVEFARSLKNTLSSFVRNSGINTIEIDKLVETVPFWEVNAENFLLAKDSKNFYVGVELDSSNQEYKFNPLITNKCQEWLRSSQENKEKNLIDYIRGSLYKSDNVVIEYISEAYLIYKEEVIKLSAICKVTK